MIASWSQRKTGSKAIANKKPVAGQPCLTPLAMKKCPQVIPATLTRVLLLVCGTIAIDPSQESANELKQHCFPEHMEDPIMMDAGIRRSAAKSVNRMPDSCGAHATWANGSSLDLEDVIQHLPG